MHSCLAAIQQIDKLAYYSYDNHSGVTLQPVRRSTSLALRCRLTHFLFSDFPVAQCGIPLCVGRYTVYLSRQRSALTPANIAHQRYCTSSHLHCIFHDKNTEKSACKPQNPIPDRSKQSSSGFCIFLSRSKAASLTRLTSFFLEELHVNF